MLFTATIATKLAVEMFISEASAAVTLFVWEASLENVDDKA